MRCSRCQQENAPGAKFCGECGARLVAPHAPRTEPPEAYTPAHRASKILSARETLAGERKQVTVLFADLKGSLELLADRDPEDARALLDTVLERMMEAVHRYEGTVNQVMGDGIMALFGAPLAHEDHAVRACYAALRMHKAMAHGAEDVRRRLGVDVQIRVGLNSGEVVVRSIGNDLQMDYSAVGQTTHLAARMEQLARPGTTLLTAATHRLAERFIEAGSQGPMPIKGLKDPVEVWELKRATPVTSSLGVIAGRAQTAMLGRGAEMATLERLLARAREGRGQVVTLIGEPGVGKSRLVWELTRKAAVDGWQMHEAACVSYGMLTPYLPVRNFLTKYFDVEDGDDARRIREKVATRMVALDTRLATHVSAILALGNVPNEDPEWAELEPTARRQRILRAVRELLLAESRRAPLLLVVENLQWADSGPHACIEELAAGLADARILVLVSARPEHRRDWATTGDATEIRLDPLPAPSAEALADSILGTEPDLAPLKRRLITHTAGNPFFLEETVQALVETRALSGERGHYRLGKPVEGIQIPDRVQAVLAARIDRLSKQGKSFLQAGAAIGADVPVALPQGVADSPSAEVPRGPGGRLLRGRAEGAPSPAGEPRDVRAGHRPAPGSAPAAAAARPARRHPPALEGSGEHGAAGQRRGAAGSRLFLPRELSLPARRARPHGRVRRALPRHRRATRRSRAGRARAPLSRSQPPRAGPAQAGHSDPRGQSPGAGRGDRWRQHRGGQHHRVRRVVRVAGVGAGRPRRVRAGRRLPGPCARAGRLRAASVQPGDRVDAHGRRVVRARPGGPRGAHPGAQPRALRAGEPHRLAADPRHAARPLPARAGPQGRRDRAAARRRAPRRVARRHGLPLAVDAAPRRGAAGHRRHRARARGRRPRHGAGPDARRARARGDGVACARRRVREGGERRARPAGVRAGARAGRRARATAADRARPLRSRPAPAPARPPQRRRGSPGPRGRAVRRHGHARVARDVPAGAESPRPPRDRGPHERGPLRSEERRVGKRVDY